MTHEQGSSVTFRTTSRSDRRRRRLQQVSGYLVVLLALSVLAVGYTAVGASSSTAQTDEGTNQSLAVREGRDLYLQGCSTCHGLDLQGGAGGPSLIGVGQASVVYQVESGRMPLQQGIQQAPRKLPKYTLEEVDQLAAFIQANGGGPEIPASGLADGDLSLGGELFRTNCSSCHNHAGSGGALTYGKYAPELAPSSERVIWGAMLSGPGNMPRFSDQQLTPDEKRAITRYITYLQDELPNPGGAGLGRYGPVPEGLVSWVVGITAMVILTLWIGARA
jgi:ubiquinol-cytochrome c reductase cytochrome c subunit